MAGYSGFSMSNNAVGAYNNGEKPLSKWSKAEILQEIRIYAKENNINIDMEKLNKVSLPVLRESFLYKTAYHHTSKFYNSTDFYAIDFDTVNEMVDLESVQKLLELTEEEKMLKKQEKKEDSPEMWECAYLVWGGTRAHPKATEQTAIGEVRGNWFYLPEGGKKSIKANGFRFIRQIKEEPAVQAQPIKEQTKQPVNKVTKHVKPKGPKL